MTNRANAAIYYATDGYKPEDKGINGRRVAGASFLRGFLHHAEVEEFVFLTKTLGEINEIKRFHEKTKFRKPLRVAGLLNPQEIAPVEVLYYPAANIASEAWRRARFGAGAWAL